MKSRIASTDGVGRSGDRSKVSCRNKRGGGRESQKTYLDFVVISFKEREEESLYVGAIGIAAMRGVVSLKEDGWRAANICAQSTS